MQALLLWFLLMLISLQGYTLTTYSTKELEELEKEFVQQIYQSPAVERHPLAMQYIQQLGKTLAQTAHLPPPFFFIVKSQEINAFAGPGGHIGIHSRLILATENESELAAVMAHELAHVRQHHLYQLLQHEKQMRVPLLASLLAAAALSMLNPALGNGALLASLGGFGQENISYIRKNEKEADSLGIAMLQKAGFNPESMVGFFKKMQENTRLYFTSHIPAILRTHPLDEDRIAQAENRIAQYSKRKPRASSIEYHLFKELIRNTTNNNRQDLLEYYQHGCKLPSFACQYGYALHLLHQQQFAKAKPLLLALIAEDKSNIFYQLAMVSLQIETKEYLPARTTLSFLEELYPKNYAILMSHAKTLIAEGDVKAASFLLLKGFRIFKKDINLCELLARTQAKAKQTAYAYFTLSQCALLKGKPKEALRLLQVTQKLAVKDPYLHARTSAMKEDILFFMKE